MSGLSNTPEVLLVNSNSDAIKKFGIALVVGAALAAIVGIQSGQVVTKNNAQAMMKAATETAITAALLPECTRQFTANSAAMAKFGAEKSSWSRGNIVSDTIKDIDGTAMTTSLASACAKSLSEKLDKSDEKKS
jgi:hypothetical protein